MKKIMGISLLAVFAVFPLMVRADNINLFTAPIGVTTDVATTSYVKGAYNELGGVINTKQNQLMNSSELSLSDTVLTSVRGSEEASDRHLVTEKAVADAVAGAIGAQDFSSYATKTGVAATVNAATATGTVQIAQTWGSDETIPHTITSDVAVNGYVPGTVAQPTTPTPTEEPSGN